MTAIYLLFKDEAKTVATGFADSEQPYEYQPYQELAEDTDPRYIAYLNVLLPTNGEAAIKKRDDLLAMAAIRISPLQYAVDLDDATVAETALLKKWKQYSVALNRIAQQAGFPDTIEWPTEP